jgi:hypothetical protein
MSVIFIRTYFLSVVFEPLFSLKDANLDSGINL